VATNRAGGDGSVTGPQRATVKVAARVARKIQSESVKFSIWLGRIEVAKIDQDQQAQREGGIHHADANRSFP
jgi:hypothetical protein